MPACGELTGQQGVIPAPPQGMDLCQQKHRSAPSERQRGASGSQRHMRAPQAQVLRHPPGRWWEGQRGAVGPAQTHTVWNTPPSSFPGAQPLFSREAPPALGLAPPLCSHTPRLPSPWP